MTLFGLLAFVVDLYFVFQCSLVRSDDYGNIMGTISCFF